MVCHGKCALAVSLTCEADQVGKSHTLTDSALNFYRTIVQETKDEVSLLFKICGCNCWLNVKHLVFGPAVELSSLLV